MRKAKVEDKSEKSFDSFFESEIAEENNALSFTDNANPSTLESAENLTGKTNPFPNLLKQILLFLPGTFLLYFVGFVSTVILIDFVIFLISSGTLPPSAPFQISLFGIPSALFQTILLTALGVLGIFMTWFGLGDLKNKKHLAIPASIIFTGAAIAAVMKVIAGLFGGGFLEELDKYFIYLLPLILIVPILVKGWIDKETE